LENAANRCAPTALRSAAVNVNATYAARISVRAARAGDDFERLVSPRSQRY
jgi:hypothetical protein